MTDLHSLAHALMVDRARNGDQAAFTELVRQHRSQMLQWANRMVKDPMRAEDIVQDALLQVLKSIDRLNDSEKFIPWLRTLVRNQALMAVRGAARKREHLAVGSVEDEYIYAITDQTADNPELRMIAKLALAEVNKLLSRLGEKERAVMEATALAGLSVQETAEALSLKAGAIYTALSRSRVKLTEARFTEELDHYCKVRRNYQPSSKAKIESVKYYSFASSYNTMASMMAVTLICMGVKHISLSEIMGATGHAFTLYAAPDLGLSSAYAYDWAGTAKTGWRRLGFSSSCYGGAGKFMKQPDELMDAMDVIYRSAQEGIPVMAWQLSNAEFGLIFGYDDESRQWSVMDTSAMRKGLPYSKLGRLKPESEWFIAAPVKVRPGLFFQPAEIFRTAAEHIRASSKIEMEAVSHGIGAYRLWIELFQQQSVLDPLGIAFNAAVTTEARAHAVRFLHRVTEKGRIPEQYPAAIPALTHAKYLYQRIEDGWSRIAAMFPLPFSADPAAPGPADRTIRILEKASAMELKAADVLEEAAFLMEKVDERQ